MYLVGLFMLILDIIPGFLIMVFSLRLHKNIVSNIEKTKGSMSGSYKNFLAFMIILIASVITVYVSLYTMDLTSYLLHLFIPHGL